MYLVDPELYSYGLGQGRANIIFCMYLVDPEACVRDAAVVHRTSSDVVHGTLHQLRRSQGDAIYCCTERALAPGFGARCVSTCGMGICDVFF